MRTHTKIHEALEAICRETAITISKAARALLEEKHLYQSIDIDVDAIIKGHHIPYEAFQQSLSKTVKPMAGWPWQVSMTQPASGWVTNELGSYSLQWRPADIKVFCPTCDRVEPFNLVDCGNLLDYKLAMREQVYALTFQCQSCKGIPQAFLIRRVSGRLTLSGRVPMEQVVVPKTIPKTISRYYSGAVIAHQSGQTLAALFMLRTLCEQWARLHATPTAYADKAIDAYMNSLPDDFKSRFPSLRKMYEDLSEKLHGAQADSALFESVLQDLQEHFEARALFKIKQPSEVTPPLEAALPVTNQR